MAGGITVAGPTARVGFGLGGTSTAGDELPPHTELAPMQWVGVCGPLPVCPLGSPWDPNSPLMPPLLETVSFLC